LVFRAHGRAGVVRAFLKFFVRVTCALGNPRGSVLGLSLSISGQIGNGGRRHVSTASWLISRLRSRTFGVLLGSVVLFGVPGQDILTALAAAVP
jgi:hypothetical protein